MNWVTLILLLIQYGPKLLEALKSLIEAIRAKNPEKGAEAIGDAADVARDLVICLQGRSDLTNEQKREQAWRDLVIAMKFKGVVLSETNARTLAQNMYQDVSGK